MMPGTWKAVTGLVTTGAAVAIYHSSVKLLSQKRKAVFSSSNVVIPAIFGLRIRTILLHYIILNINYKTSYAILIILMLLIPHS